MQRSPVTISFYEDLVGRAMWMHDENTTIQQLVEEKAACKSDRADRLKIYDFLIKQGKVTAFETMMMEIDYCTYEGQLNDEINFRNFRNTFKTIELTNTESILNH